MNKSNDVDAAPVQPIVHTPGPWEAVRSLTCGHVRAAHNYQQNPKEEWTDADLKLISAAPDLLAALYRIRAQLCREHSWFVVESDYAYINEAIRKATH
jgi:hypothetical protein